MVRRVVVTGIGPVTAHGIGKDEFFSNILEGKTIIREIPEQYEKTYKFKSRFYVPRPEFLFSEYNISTSHEEIMGETAKLSVLGTMLALQDAGVIIKKEDKFFKIEGLDNCNIIVGLGMSSLQTAFQSYLAHVFGKDNNVLESYGENFRFNRMVIPILMPNSVSAWISIFFGIQGANFTINASCASGTCAIGQAYMDIINGKCDSAITGGVECLYDKHGAIMRGFDMLAALTRTLDGKPLPFSNKRSGFLLNEGAGCILVLEELEQAKRRGANIYAEIVGYECNSDAFNIVQIEPSGKQIISLLEKLINNRKVDYLNAHGTGTLTNDQIEAEVIKHIFGDKSYQPYINSTKGILGHSIGASGALEVAITALSIKESKIHGNIIDDPIDNLNLVNEAINATINYAVSTSYGFGGHNAAILFKRYEVDE